MSRCFFLMLNIEGVRRYEMIQLPERQRRFCDEYVRTGNITQSYLSAYDNVKKESTATSAGSRLLTNVNVKAYIEAKLDELKKESIADMDEILQFYSSVVRGELTEEEVASTPLGVEKVDKTPTIRDRIKAADELTKRFTLGNNQVLKDKLLEAQIKKILKEIEVESTVEDKLTEYFDKLDEVIQDE